MRKYTDNFEAGVGNLLFDCAQAKPGERILLVGESGGSDFFEPGICDDVARVARDAGIDAAVILVEPVSDASRFPQAVTEAMQAVDVVIFFSRLGDQVRFIATPGNSRKIMCYALTRKLLSSAFSSTGFSAMKKTHDLLKEEITASTKYEIKAACGTRLSGEIAADKSSLPTLTDFSLELFPVMIFPPVNCHRLHGQLVLKDFLLSSSTRTYEDSVLILKSPVTAIIEDSRMVHFEGDDRVITSIRKQLERAAGITGGDPYQINSWHTGINPYTFYETDPYVDLERWGTVAYGSPRYTHIHAAGNNPGDISIQLFDASISFDERLFWDRGRFVFLDRPELQSFIENPGNEMLDSSPIMSIGI
ncbi:MAG: hypothetical protein ACI9LO_000494 [Planctomycetota bacterium]|jgi:hypothetical protein